MDTKKIKNNGLYIFFEDGHEIIISNIDIERFAFENFLNSDKIPAAINKIKNLERCHICPKQDGICEALIPIMPYIEVLDNYKSFDRVEAAYKNSDMLYVSETTVQEAVKYIAITGLMCHCLVGKKYWKYLFETNPLMSIEKLFNRFYLNLYWIKKGDPKIIDEYIKRFSDDITVMTTNVSKLLNVICHSDAFSNSFANMHIGTWILNRCIETNLAETFDEFDYEQFLKSLYIN